MTPDDAARVAARRGPTAVRRSRSWGAPAAAAGALAAVTLLVGAVSPVAGGLPAPSRTTPASTPLDVRTSGARARVRSRASVAPLPPGSRLLGPLAGSTELHAEVVLEPRDPSALEAFDKAVSTPGSSRFGHYLAPGAFRAAFGPTPATVAAVRAWLAGRGLVVGPTAPDGLAVPVSASAARMGRAFGSTLVRYRLPSGRVVRAPTAAPLVPASLAGAVGGVVGLDDLALPVPELARPVVSGARASSGGSPAAGRGAVQGARADAVVAHLAGPAPTVACQDAIDSRAQAADAYTVDQLAQAYSFSSLYPGDEGAGVTIGVYELEPYEPSDVTTFEDCYTPAITTVLR